METNTQEVETTEQIKARLEKAEKEQEIKEAKACIEELSAVLQKYNRELVSVTVYANDQLVKREFTTKKVKTS
jgi:hypothetical protein